MNTKPIGIVAAFTGLLLAGCASAPPEPVPEIPEIRPGLLAGYLGNNLPDSLSLLPEPPAAGSAAFAQDEAVSRAAQKLRDTPRGALATADADLGFPNAALAFACALGIPITQQYTPRLYLLLRRVLTDAALATNGAKDRYRRVRPFAHYSETTCTPADDARLRTSGSYPSGHTSIGWAWALVLTELAPDRTDALLARGRSFGESRLVCNAHWLSDVQEGRTIGAAAFARLQSDAVFLADVDAARLEIQRLRATATAPPGDCDAETSALAIVIPGGL
jgi:acid phosphatase (class A)